MRQVAIGTAVAILVAWVHGRALGAFFTSPDDLVHLQQAAGLTPTLPTPFRLLSQVVYFRSMYAVFGTQPMPFHVVTMGVHLVNVALVVGVLRRLGVASMLSWSIGALFGMLPLWTTLLSSGVGINDLGAMNLTLLGFHVIIGRRRLPGLAPALQGLGLLFKESVIALPLLGLAMCFRPTVSERVRALLGMLVVSTVAGVVFILLRPHGLAPDANVYGMRFGSNVVANLMTYTAWTVELREPLPDLMSVASPEAWRVAVPLYVALVATWLASGRDWRIGLGLAWWIAGLLPVLFLERQVHRHYMYAAAPGLVTALVVTASVWATRIAGLLRIERTRVLAWAGVAICVAVVALYGVMAHRLVKERYERRVPGTVLALDPVGRRREVAQNALQSIGTAVAKGARKLVVLQPGGVGKVYGVRSGSEVGSGRRAMKRGYDLLRESLNHGSAVLLFYPEVDTVRFAEGWTDGVSEYDVLVPLDGGVLQHVGRGVDAHRWIVERMMDLGWFPQAAAYVDGARGAFPEDSILVAHQATLSRIAARAGAQGR